MRKLLTYTAAVLFLTNGAQAEAAKNTVSVAAETTMAATQEDSSLKKPKPSAERPQPQSPPKPRAERSDPPAPPPPHRKTRPPSHRKNRDTEEDPA